MAGAAAAAVGAVVLAAKYGAPSGPEQFVLFRNLLPGEDPFEIAKQYMGENVTAGHGLFSADFVIPGNPNLSGLIL